MKDPSVIHEEETNKYFEYEDLPFLDSKEVSFIKVCDDIYKAVNDHIMILLALVIVNLKEVEQEYYDQSAENDSTEKLDLVTFTVPNLYKV